MYFFFLLLIQPMMEHVRIHPELVTGSKDHELDPRRYIHIPSAIKEVYKWSDFSWVISEGLQ